MSLDINLHFNSIEEALTVLSKLRDINSSGSKRIDEKKKPQQDAKYRGMTHASLDHVLEDLKQHYPSRAFRWSEACETSSSSFSRSMVGYALRYGLEKGKIYRFSYGKYSFFQPTQQPVIEKKQRYTVDKQSLIDIAVSEKQTVKLLSVFKLMGHVAKTVALYFSENGISVRFFTNEERSAMLSVFVGKSFLTYHVRMGKHVRLQLSMSSLLDILPRRRNGELHIKVEKENSTHANAGYLANEHTINVIACDVSDTAYEIENPLEEPKDYAELQIGRSLFQDRLQDVYAHSDIVRIAISKDKVTIDSSLESQGYSKTLTSNDSDIQIHSSQTVIEQCFFVKELLPLVRHRIVGHDSLTLKMNRQVMFASLAKEKDLQVSAYFSPCKIETDASPSSSSKEGKVTAAELKDVAERIRQLEKQMGL